jgi:hypothetical protein
VLIPWQVRMGHKENLTASETCVSKNEHPEKRGNGGIWHSVGDNHSRRLSVCLADFSGQIPEKLDTSYFRFADHPYSEELEEVLTQ